ncbi:uncharacterized protein LOC119450602 isoform X1 [Dermacentor silvarum]|uniref:uncharacterized protein LOC119450602 isoform X1 n=1 Tax=Dermacentor silvarum TaxID=543639 RepID=UPI002101CD4C|nr:uncharacterized protein LOC119450602 isoform X1 [Dermacentor silvarum]
MRHFGFLVLLGLFIGTQAVNLTDLLEALNTTETTWLKRRTYNMSDHTCVYTQKIDLNETNYKFEQGYMTGHTKLNHTLYAKLGENRTAGPWMEVSSEPDHRHGGLRYFLQYWNGTEKCGILKTGLSGEDQYEVHVWDSKVNDTNQACMQKYDDLKTGKGSYEVYSTSCKTAA